MFQIDSIDKGDTPGLRLNNWEKQQESPTAIYIKRIKYSRGTKETREKCWDPGDKY